MRERVVVYRHALRNAMIPLVTVLGVAIGLLVAGSFFIERIFNIPGIGQISLGSIGNRDYPIIQATVVLLACGAVWANLISALFSHLVHPPIKILLHPHT